MTWLDRLQPTLLLTSPSGIVFSAGWRGDPREMEKKLGIFEHPNLPGATVQDLDVKAVRNPLNFMFDGENHDLTAKYFFEVCKEKGLWKIDHPVRGVFYWQLISVREETQPVDSGNITVFATEWIEPADGIVSISVSQRVSVVKNNSSTMQDTAAGQFEDIVQLDKPSYLSQFRNSVTKATDAVVNTLAPLTKTVAEVNAAIESVHRGITVAITSTGLSTLALAGQIQSLVTLPASAIDSIDTRIDFYSDLLTQTLGLLPSTSAPNGVNTLAVQELVCTSCLAAIADIITDGDPKTREEAIVFIEKINLFFDDLTTGLDAGQDLFAGLSIENQYFSQSATYNDAVILVSSLNDLLLRRSFDLSAAKWIVLDRPRTPVEIAITESVDLDLFISSNKLSGTDILLLQPGREVVVYS